MWCRISRSRLQGECSVVDKNEILRLLHKYFYTPGRITIDDFGLVTCNSGVELKRGNLVTRLPVSFDRVDGNFVCINNQLTTLQGAPTSVGGSFLCSNNQLTTLAGAPTSVDDSFDCSVNQLTTLEHAPQSVGGDFGCYNNQLTTLEGLPVVTKTLYLSYSPTLPLLRCLLAKQVVFSPELENKTIETILNQYAGQGEAGAFACGAELASAGYKENAKW